MTHHIRTWNDLRAYGIELLPGEACAVGQRGLCDVSEKGKKLLCDLLNVSDLTLHSNMNSKVNGEPAIGCIMLPYDWLTDLAVWTLLMRKDVLEVWVMSDGIMGVTQQYLSEYRELAETCKGRANGVLKSIWKRNRFNHPCNAEGTVHRSAMWGTCP